MNFVKFSGQDGFYMVAPIFANKAYWYRTFFQGNLRLYGSVSFGKKDDKKKVIEIGKKINYENTKFVSENQAMGEI